MTIPNSFFAELARTEQRRSQAQTEGLPALQRLAIVAQRESGQAGTIRRFLLGLYNGQAHPFNLSQLRALDLNLHVDCLAVLRMDYHPTQEIHQYLDDGAKLFRQLRDREFEQ